MQIVVFGAQGSAREVAWLASPQFSGAQQLETMCFVDAPQSSKLGASQNGLPILSAQDARKRFPGASALLAVGEPALRKRLYDEATLAGFPIASVIHPSAQVAPSATIGSGLVCYPNTMISTNVVIGGHVQINIGASVSHDVTLGDFVTISPQACICGYVEIGRAAFIGAGAVVINGTPDKPLVIGEEAVIAAGACVVGDVAKGVIVAGVPAKPR